MWKISLQKEKTSSKQTQRVCRLWLPSKSGGCTVEILAENKIVKYNTKLILKTFKNFYLNLA